MRRLLAKVADALEFDNQLRMVSSTAEGRADLREAAILVGKLGLTSADIEPMARQWVTSPHRTYYELMTAARRIEEQAQCFAPPEEDQ